MDLPTCPACKQSVLDEDAAECPFCGAPLKGGAPASRAPAAPRPAAPQPVVSEKAQATAAAKAQAPAARRPSSPPAVSRDVPDDDDPFGIDPAATARAIPLSPRPAAGKSLEVKCPMCETPGFVSPKAAGQQVKCCNPECLVPVFTIPAPRKVEPPPPPPKAKPPLFLYACGALVAIGILVIAGLKMMPQAPTERPPILVAPPAGSGGKTGPADGSSITASGAPDTENGSGQPKAQVDPRANLIRDTLRKLVNAAFDAPLIRKADCRRMAATAFVATGDLASAKEQLDQLQRVGKQTPYEGCQPTVQLAWKQLTAAPDQFPSTVAEARRLFDSYSQRGRGGVEGAIAVAAVLAVAGKPDEARQVLDTQRRTSEINQLAAALQVVKNDGTFDLDSPFMGRSVADHWLAPQEAAVTLILAAHGRWDDALAWAEKAPGLAARADATVIWAEALARSTGSDSDLQRAIDAADGAPPEVHARVLARLAAVRLAAGDQTAAAELAGRAAERLNAITPPDAARAQGVKVLLELRLPDPVPSQVAALAAADVAVVQMGLKQPEAAWENFRLAIRFLRGTAPSLSFMQQRVVETEGDPSEALRNELKSSLQLRNDSEVRRSFVRYREKCDELLAAAMQRFLWQGDVLRSAVKAGMAERVWDEIQVMNNRPDPVEKDPFLTSAVAIEVGRAFAAANKPDLRDKALGAKDRLQQGPREPLLQALPLLIEQMIDAGEVDQAALQFLTMQNDSGALHESSLRMACRLVKAGNFDGAYRLVSNLRDMSLRDDGLFLISALAARLGEEKAVSKVADRLTSNPPEFSPIAAGMVVGLANQPEAASE